MHSGESDACPVMASSSSAEDCTWAGAALAAATPRSTGGAGRISIGADWASVSSSSSTSSSESTGS